MLLVNTLSYHVTTSAYTMSGSSVTELDTSQWFVILSNLAFLVPASVALHRCEVIRTLGFAAVTAVSATYHFCADTDVCGERDIYRELDHVLAVWLTSTITLLFCSWHREIEYCIEIAVLGGVSGLVIGYTGVNNDRDNILVEVLVPAGVFIAVVIPSWKTNGLPPGLRVFLGRVLLGIALIVVGVVFFFVDIIKNYNYNHGLWHILVALGAAMLIVGLRDKALRDRHHYSTLEMT